MASPPKAVGPKAPPKKGALIQSYNSALKEDVKSLRDNFEEIIRLSHVHEKDKAYNVELDNNEIQVRGANMIRATESLLKLVSDLKDHMIINDAFTTNCDLYNLRRNTKKTVKEIDKKLAQVWADMVKDLEDIEEDYYMSAYPDRPGNR